MATEYAVKWNKVKKELNTLGLSRETMIEKMLELERWDRLYNHIPGKNRVEREEVSVVYEDSNKR
jgi:ribosomal protein L20A (L18A)